MDNIVSSDAFVGLVAGTLASEMFTLVDVGCAGGVGAPWLAFGDKLRVFGFDALAAEVQALNARRWRGEHHYFNKLVAAPPGDDFAREALGRSALQRSPWHRLAIDWWLRLRNDPEAPMEAAHGGSSSPPRTPADGDSFIRLPELLDGYGDYPIDFIKIDVDGADYDILHSCRTLFARRNVLAIGIEVNFFGSDDPYCNTFHNVDRFLRAEGFELFDLSRRRYSNRCLPVPSSLHPYPAETHLGRILQGDALYARDPQADYFSKYRFRLAPETYLKLAAIFALFGLPDCAAELVWAHATEFPAGFATRALDLLAEQAQPGGRTRAYKDYVEAFQRGALTPAGPLPPASGFVLKDQPMAAAVGRPVPLNGATLDEEDGLRCAGDSAPWAYALELPLEFASNLNTFVRVRLQIEVQEGAFAIGLLSRDRRRLEAEQIVDVGAALVELRACAQDICAVILRPPARREGETPRARLRKVEVWEEAGGAG